MEMLKDLHSLRSLYRILQTTGNDMDEGTRLLFKNLLDAARDNFLLTSTKIIASGGSMSGNSNSALHSNVHMHNLPKLEEESIMKTFSPQAVSVQTRKKRCRVCQQMNLARQFEDANYGDKTAKDFSKQVSISIKLIESSILFLQKSSDILNPIQLRYSSERNQAENSLNDESSSYHYVRGLRIPSIPAENDTHIETDPPLQQYKKISKSQLDFSQTMSHKGDRAISRQNESLDMALTHNKKTVKPTLLDYESPINLPSVEQHQKATLADQEESSPTTSSYSSRSKLETETETSREETRSNSSIYSSAESHESTGSHIKMYSRNPDKGIGQLRRFRNKLRLIFHHHHHHHHHHHAENVHSSIWKHLGKIFHHKDQQRIYEEKAVGRLKRTGVKEKQAGQFQALVKGMMRHVKHTKKSKLPKGGLRRGLNKHWWQMFKRRRHSAAKLPSGGRVRIRFKNKKPKLRALRY